MGTKLYIGNLPFSWTEIDLSSAFAQNGFTPLEAKVVIDPATNRGKGFGFVVMRSPEDAEDAIQALNGLECGGRKVVVSEAHDKGTQKTSRGPRERPMDGRRR